MRLTAAAAALLCAGIAGATVATAASASSGHGSTQYFPFKNSSLPLDARLDDLLPRMTLRQKIGQMFQNGKMAFGNDVLPKGGDLPSTAMSNLGVCATSRLLDNTITLSVPQL